jgi:hypothetical protein
VRLNVKLSPASLTRLWFGTAANQIELRKVISWFFCVVLSAR